MSSGSSGLGSSTGTTGIAGCGEIANIPTAANAEFLPFAGTSAAPAYAYVTNTSEQPTVGMCISGCDSDSPVFQEVVVGTNAGVPVQGLSVISDGTRVAVVWLTEKGAGNRRATIEYAECTSNCAVASSWVEATLTNNILFSEFPNLDPQIQSQSPNIRMVSSGGLLGVAFSSPTGVVYGECPGTCSVDTNWNYGLSFATTPGLPFAPGLAVSVQEGVTGQVITRYTSSRTHINVCSSGGCLGTDQATGWTNTTLPNTASGTLVNFQEDAQIALQSNGLPVVAGLDNNEVFAARCSSAPCTAAADWTSWEPATDGTGLSPDTIGLQLDSSDLMRVVYSALPSNGNPGRAQLNQLTETGVGVFAAAPPTLCDGGVVEGTSPALVLTPSGNPRVLYLSNSTPQGIAQGAYYIDGP